MIIIRDSNTQPQKASPNIHCSLPKYGETPIRKLPYFNQHDEPHTSERYTSNRPENARRDLFYSVLSASSTAKPSSNALSSHTCTPQNIVDIHLNPQPVKTSNYGDDTFVGYCLDSGASRSTIDANQERSYRQITAHSAEIDKSRTIYRFGSSLSQSKGITKLRMLLPDGRVLFFYVDIMADDIHLRTGLDVLRRPGLILEFHSDAMWSGQYLWTVPLRYHRGQAFLLLPKGKCILYEH